MRNYLGIILLLGLLLNSLSKPHGNPLGFDNFGYYLYLPALVIHHDLGLEKTDWVKNTFSKVGGSKAMYQIHKGKDKKHVIRYPIGSALLRAPFFMASHLLAMGTNSEMDGISPIYQIGQIIGGCVLIIMAFFFLNSFLARYFNWKVRALAFGMLVLGTNVLVTLKQANIGVIISPHTQLFFCYSLLLFLTERYFRIGKGAITIVALVGFMALIRPTEIIALVIPALWGISNVTELKSRIKKGLKNKPFLFKSVLLLASIGFIQFGYWKYTTGHWIYDSYQNAAEGLDFFTPHLIDFLFSCRKGWFIYTPLALLGIIGLWKIRSREFGWGLFFFCVLNIWICSSWTNWWYAFSFSQRSMIQSYPILLLGFAGVLELLSKKRWRTRAVVGGLILIFSVFNMFQVWQFGKGIIHGERMTKEAYWAVFLKTKKPNNLDSLLVPLSSKRGLGNIPHQELYTQKRLFEMGGDYWQEIEYTPATIQATDTYYGKMKIPVKELLSSGSNHGWITLRLEVENREETPCSLRLVSEFKNSSGNYGYMAFPGKITSGLQVFEYHFTTPEPRFRSDVNQYYLWNFQGCHFRMHDLQVEVRERI